MAMHNLHPDLATCGLADGCPRCEQLADAPFARLDDAMLGALIDRCEAGEDARSDNERRAMLIVENAMERLRHYDTMQRYAQEADKILGRD